MTPKPDRGVRPGKGRETDLRRRPSTRSQRRTVKAGVEARRKSVGLAWSNPCFEVWLILHLAEHTSHLENGDRAGDRIGKILKREWDKSALVFADFEPGIADAVQRAKVLGAAPVANPSTDVWRVLEALGFAG